MVEDVSQPSELAAQSLITKLRAFVTEQLSDDEGALFAALIAPGVSMAYAEDEVSGFGVTWGADTLPQALSTALRENGIEVTGLTG
jgi:hypothetical protein